MAKPSSFDRSEDGPFRDFLPGLKGKRDDLLRRRRDELATMPHALRRIYVARVARIAAAASATVGGAILLGAAVHPGYQEYLSGLLPGREPAVLSTLLLSTLVLSTLAYLLGRCLAEARFTKAMSSCVLPGNDVSTDVERLGHERPDDVASAMIRRFERPGAALVPAGIALAAPCALGWATMAAIKGGYPDERSVELIINRLSGSLVAIGAAGLIAALYLAVSKRRDPLARTWAIAAGLGIGAAVATAPLLGADLLILALGLVIVAVSIGANLALLRKEQRIVVLEDLDASLWSVGTLWIALRDGVRAGRRQLTVANLRRVPPYLYARLQTPRGQLVGAAALLSLVLGAYAFTTPADVPPPRAAVPSVRLAVAPLPAQMRIPAESFVHNEQVTIAATIHVHAEAGGVLALLAPDGRPLTIPPRWRASVQVESTSREALQGHVTLVIDGAPYSEVKAWNVAPAAVPRRIELSAITAIDTQARYQVILTRD